MGGRLNEMFDEFLECIVNTKEAEWRAGFMEGFRQGQKWSLEDAEKEAKVAKAMLHYGANVEGVAEALNITPEKVAIYLEL